MTMADTFSVTGAYSPKRRALNHPYSKTPSNVKRSQSQKRTPLQEKSSSDTNIGASWRGQDKAAELDVYSGTPFPTKPQHVLLPSTVRKQKSFQNIASGLFTKNQRDPLRDVSSESNGSAKAAPVVHLEKSVTTLRDMYEAQERSSRPSTAASAYARPTTSSSRLRSASSSDGLAGRYAWEKFHQISSDDLALLPSLNETMLRKMDSETSFTSRMTPGLPMTSSPNYRVYATSSPRMPVFRDEPGLSSETTGPSSSFEMSPAPTSSPNFVRIGRSSSFGEAGVSLPSSSSANLVKLGTSSPLGRERSSPVPSTGSGGSLKRKRDNTGENRIASTRARIFDVTSPHYAVTVSDSEPSLLFSDDAPLPSSPPEPTSAASRPGSSPVFRFGARSRRTSDHSSPSSAHATLQAALSSSPMPPIQYPVVRAPRAPSQILTVPKRNQSGQSDGGPYMSRLSPVPSEWDETSQKSRILEDLEEEDAELASLALRYSANESQIRIMVDDDHEASDELSALPRGSMYRSPPMVPVRTNSLYQTMSASSASQSQSRLGSLRHSMDSRLNSMKSYTHSRRDSTKSSSLRPTSSSSATTVVVPTWARRYYSGLYRDSFHNLYPPSQNNSATHLSLPPPRQAFQRSHSDIRTSSSMQPSSQASHHSRPSIQSIRRSLRDSIVEIIPSRLRPRIEARKSHLTAGMGPLVSHPVRPESAIHKAESNRYTYTIRHISASLDPVDPRAHWASIDGERESLDPQQYHINPYEQQHHHTHSNSSSSNHYNPSYHTSLASRSRFRFMPSPHLHHDRRLNTGSSTSRGYGHPFNQHPDYSPPPLNSTSFFCFNIHSGTTQKVAFIIGFLCPISWFIASALPLPNRPVEFSDIEKEEWDHATNNGRRQLGEYEEMDVVARLRMERHTKGLEEMEWQKARWWRRLNRVMSIVGVVVVILVIVLAVVGTRDW